MKIKGYYCEACKYEFREYQEFQSHIEEKHREIRENHNKKFKKENSDASTVSNLVPSHARVQSLSSGKSNPSHVASTFNYLPPCKPIVQTVSAGESMAYYLEKSFDVRKEYELEVREGVLWIKKEFNKLSEFQTEKIKDALKYIKKWEIKWEEEN